MTLSDVLNVSKEGLVAGINVLTSHSSKGLEAYRVIVADATSSQYPMLNTDNLLFEIFGASTASIYDDERRLFYVSTSRAERELYLLTESGKESPFIEELTTPRGLETEGTVKPTIEQPERHQRHFIDRLNRYLGLPE